MRTDDLMLEGEYDWWSLSPTVTCNCYHPAHAASRHFATTHHYWLDFVILFCNERAQPACTSQCFPTNAFSVQPFRGSITIWPVEADPQWREPGRVAWQNEDCDRYPAVCLSACPEGTAKEGKWVLWLMLCWEMINSVLYRITKVSGSLLCCVKASKSLHNSKSSLPVSGFHLCQDIMTDAVHFPDPMLAWMVVT